MSERYIDFLITKTGFKTIKKKNFEMIIYSIAEPTAVPADYTEDFQEDYTKNKAYIWHIKYQDDLIENLNEKISKSVDPVFIFGAHVFTQYLLALG